MRPSVYPVGILLACRQLHSKHNSVKHSVFVLMFKLSSCTNVPKKWNCCEDQDCHMRIRPDRFAVHKLDLPINCDAALSAARDYFERVTREYHTKGPDGRDRSQVPLARHLSMAWSAPSPVASLQFLFCSAC